MRSLYAQLKVLNGFARLHNVAASCRLGVLVHDVGKGV